MNLAMNMLDLTRWQNGVLKAFAVPVSMCDDLMVGDLVGIQEPFKKLTATRTVEIDGKEKKQRYLVGVRYRDDDACYVVEPAPNDAEIKESSRWSPASQLPIAAIRHYARIKAIGEAKPLQSLTEEDLQLLCLDYNSQNDPQLLMEEYRPIKDYELLYSWWKDHYKATLKDCDNPMVVVLRIRQK